MKQKVELKIDKIEKMRIVIEELNPLGSFKVLSSGGICGNVLMEELELPEGWHYTKKGTTTFGEIKTDKDQHCYEYEYWS